MEMAAAVVVVIGVVELRSAGEINHQSYTEYSVYSYEYIAYNNSEVIVS